MNQGKLYIVKQEIVRTNIDILGINKLKWMGVREFNSDDLVFPVVRYSCESWTVKKAEHQGIDTFKLCCSWRLLNVPWTAKRSKQSILREINPEYSLEELRMKLKFQYFGHLMQTDDSLEKSLMLRKIEGRRRRGCQRMRWLMSISDGQHHWCNEHELEQTLGDGEGHRGLGCCSPWGHKDSDTTEWLNNNSHHYKLRKECVSWVYFFFFFF